MDKRRVRILKDGAQKKGAVAYWMSRDQRVNDNWALIFAQLCAIEKKVPMCVIFCVVPQFLNATIRQYDFMIKGLKGLETGLKEKNIPFFLLLGSPEKEVIEFIKIYNIGLLITDFDPLRIKREWKNRIAQKIEIPFLEVDAHNIIPCWVTSNKQEYGAYTIRPKIHKQLKEFLTEFPIVSSHPFLWNNKQNHNDWDSIINKINCDRTVSPVNWIKPGEKEAYFMLKKFIEKNLKNYHLKKNDPNSDVLSNLSPYLHFGHISAQRVVLEVLNAHVEKGAKEAFLEELVVRRELSDNYCFYNNKYDRFEGFPEWAQKTLNDHRNDKRYFVYTLEEFEKAQTHDPLWNAAQLEMIITGKMHGYMRMYWAKKILEWSNTPEEAIEIAIYLNDKYELDGRDPNGYTGIAWSIGGVHDRPWRERPIFGKVRYMSYEGCKKKFDIKNYIRKWVS